MVTNLQENNSLLRLVQPPKPYGYCIRKNDGSLIVYQYPFDGSNNPDKPREHVPVMALDETQARALAWAEELNDGEYSLIPVYADPFAAANKPVGYAVRAPAGDYYSSHCNSGNCSDVHMIEVGESAEDAHRIAIGNEDDVPRGYSVVPLFAGEPQN